MAIIMYPEIVTIVRCYDSSTEIFMLNDNGTVVHKRPNIRFIRNYASDDNVVSYEQRRTYGAEQITNPGSISRTGYTFKGWATTRGSSTPMTFPRTVPSTLESQDSVDYGYAIWGAATPTTATPTVGTPFCQANPDWATYIVVSVTNNDSSSVTIRNYESTIGTIGPGATSYLEILLVGSLPYDYNISISATATDKIQSTTVKKKGTIYVCIATD